ncbi:MAG TPA: helix-turn-helix domain-containing protein [Chloroflexota bacterium]
MAAESMPVLTVDASSTDELGRLRAALQTLQTQNSTLRQLVAIHDRLGALVLLGGDISTITSVLADLIGRRVLLLDGQLQASAMAVPSEMSSEFRWAPAPAYVSGVLATLAGERRPLRIPPMADWGVEAVCVLAPVSVGEAILGYLAILEEQDLSPSEDVDLQVVQHAATVYALAMMRERMATEVAQQLRDELFEGLLHGRAQDEQVALERAVRLGYDPRRQYRVLVLVADDPASRGEQRPESLTRRRHLLEGLAEVVRRRAPGAIGMARRDDLVVLVPEVDGARRPAEVGRIAVQQAQALVPTWQVTVGLGDVCSSATEIARSHEQARRSVDTARRFGRRGDVVTFEELGLYRLLFHVKDSSELRGFVDQVLGALLAYDQRHQAHLVLTLSTFLAHNGNLQATARELSLHVNSVAYRLQRIQAIAHLNLEHAEDRLLAQVALKILSGTEV